MAGPKYNVVFDDGGILEIIEDTPFIPSRERDLLQAWKAMVQKPPLGPFQKSNILWLPHVTSGHGLYNNAEIAIIPRDCLNDFIEGKQNNFDFPCKFMKTKDHIRSSTPNTLTHP
jgi:hypothetical protein